MEINESVKSFEVQATCTMEKYVEIVCVGVDKLPATPLRSKNKSQAPITSFAVETPRYSVRRHSPTRSAPVKWPAKRPVGRPPKAKKARTDFNLDRAVSKEYQQWVKVEARYDEAWFYTHCGTPATDSPRNVPKKHRGTYTTEKRLEVREYMAAYDV